MSDLAFSKEAKDVCTELRVDPANGLKSTEAAKRLNEYGRNELPPPEKTPFLKLVAEQFEDLLVLILLGAAVVSFLLALFEDSKDRATAFVEPMVILAILIANATVGVIQESNAESAIEALRKSEARTATVMRDGEKSNIPASELVPGDMIYLDEGDKVPADGRLLRIDTATVEIEQSMLTGESEPTTKHADPIDIPVALVTIRDKRNMAFSGTLVVRGKFWVVVTTTGSKTEMGKIADELNKKKEDEKTPLQEKLDEFGEQLSKVIGIICVVVWLINIGHFTDPEHGSWAGGAIYYFKIAVALAVAAIPEGLPAVVTTCLALGTMKMAKKNAIVRRLPSVETLGCTTVICSDKTGTLTTNQMSVQHVITADALSSGVGLSLREYKVEGDSFAPFGVVRDARNQAELVHPAAQSEALSEVAKICTLCNESHLVYHVEDKKSTGVWSKTGTPTEAALKVVAEKIGVPDEKECQTVFQSSDPRVRVNATEKYWSSRFNRERLLEFDRVRKTMSVVCVDSQKGSRHLYCKGAVKAVLDRSVNIYLNTPGKGLSSTKLTPVMRESIMKKFNELASQGLRCMALATLDNPDPSADYRKLENFSLVESQMTFVGMVGMLDPPRPQVAQSIERCYQAGIRVIVITGDARETAESICRRIGVFGPEEDLRQKSFTGADFSQMTPTQQEEVLKTASLFSQVEPHHKSKLVEILKKQGEVVAMTGDGVNDAPALKAAHIGVAMGSGTDVAREASAMVLQDDNFATIVMAVEEGRAIYSNTKQFIRYLISSNIGEVVCIFLTAAIGMPEALIPVQLLWVNLVTDGLPATALGFNPPDKDVMLKPPRSNEEPIVNGWMFFRYLAIGGYVGASTVLGFIYWYLYAETGPHVTFKQLSNFHSCGKTDATDIFPKDFDCNKFHNPIPSTVSLSILVLIEMFNALNALSENQSIFSVPPWANVWVLAAIVLSLTLHVGIVYIEFFNRIFHVAPLGWVEWEIVFWWSVPILFIDEFLKFVTRNISARSGVNASKRKDE